MTAYRQPILRADRADDGTWRLVDPARGLYGTIEAEGLDEQTAKWIVAATECFEGTTTAELSEASTQAEAAGIFTAVEAFEQAQRTSK